MKMKKKPGFSHKNRVSDLDSRWWYVIIGLTLKSARRSRPGNGVRKVRAPQGTVLGNTQAGRPDGKGPQKQTASGQQSAANGWLSTAGKGEKAV